MARRENSLSLARSRIGRTRTLAGCIAMLLGAALSSSCVLARPSQALVGNPPPAIQAETVSFASASGSRIHAWFAPGLPGHGAVLLLHGVGDDRRVMLARLRFFHQRGMSVLAPDFQGHGESMGEHITFGVLESLDAHAALRFLRAHAPGERAGVIGISMGGAAALLGDKPLDADAMVLESVYPTIREAISDRLKVWLGPLGVLGPTLAPAVIDIVGSDIGVKEEQLRPIDHIAAVHEPLLVAAGTDDHYTTLDEARALFARATAPKQFWPVTGAGHEDLYAFAPAEYERRVGGFMLEQLQKRAESSPVTPSVADSPLSRR